MAHDVHNGLLVARRGQFLNNMQQPFHGMNVLRGFEGLCLVPYRFHNLLLISGTNLLYTQKRLLGLLQRFMFCGVYYYYITKYAQFQQNT